MLKIRVKDIPPEGKERLLRLDGPWFVETMGDVEGAWAEATGEVPVHLSRTGSEILARGEVHARCTVPCARCLEPAVLEVRAPFATTFLPRGGGVPAGAGDDPDLATYEGDEIDLGALIRELVLVGIPISTLCRSDCKGLCPRCGKELNLGPCGCPSPTSSLGEALRKAARAR